MFARVSLNKDNSFQTRTAYSNIGELVASLLKMRPARPKPHACSR